MRAIYVKREVVEILAEEYNVSLSYVYRSLKFKTKGFVSSMIRVRAANEFKAFII